MRGPSFPSGTGSGPGLRRTLAGLLSLAALLLAGGCNNNPWPDKDASTNTLRSAVIENSPRHLDPTASYWSNDTAYTYQIYEPPYGYHYLKRPFQLVPKTAAVVTKPHFVDKNGQPLADDAPARAFQLVAVLRELRGCQHLVAVLAQGLTAEKAHLIKRPNDYKTFGYDEAAAPEVTEADRAAMVAAEALTDRLAVPAFSVLDQAGAAAFAAGVANIGAALA